MNKYKRYQDMVRERQDAENWLNLKDNKDSQSGNRFSLSLGHSEVMLMRCGQHSAGSQNYHESPKALNDALLVVIQNNYDSLMSQAIEFMKKNENEALISCEKEITEIQDAISKAREKLTQN